MIEDLIASASIGTGRAAPTHPAAEGELGTALAGIAKVAAESRLLGAVAILARYEAAGRLPASAPDVPEPAKDDAQPACSRRAGDLLANVLAMPNTPAKDQLLREWLGHARRAVRRPPYRSLPGLLEYGAGHKAVREAITAIAGERGAWLTRLNPRWQFAAAAPAQEDLSTTWSTGNREQRISALKSLRERDPAAARELVKTTWSEDAADDRAAFVGAITVGLSADDEGFLEASLDDRSKQVRAAAAELLARLPGSAFVRRMVERVTPLLKFEAGTKGGILRRGKAPVITVTLPKDKFEPEWARDGIVEKPEGRQGRRQWWLEQFVAAVPPTHWSGTWGLTPADCITAAGGEFGDVVRTGWRRAALRNPEPTWVEALLTSAARREAMDMHAIELLNVLPAQRKDDVAADVLAGPKMDFDEMTGVLNAAKFPLGPKSAAVVIEKVEKRAKGAKGEYDYHLAAMLPDLALRMPTSVHDELVGRWHGNFWDANRKTLDEFFRVLSMRQAIEKEFSS